MRKENVFLVSGRHCQEDGTPRGSVVNYVVCGVDDKAVRFLMKSTAPDFGIISLSSLVTLEERAKKVKAVLAGADNSWLVLVDPALENLQAV